MPRLLTDSEVQEGLGALKRWRRDGKFITKVFEFKSFMQGIEFVNEVARVAEREGHHPDIGVRYTTVTLSIQTHSEGGVTKWDLDLAEAIERTLAKGRSRRTSH